MCGIFGYVGRETAVGDAVLRALKLLEYRGYDSWGIAVAVNGHLEVTKRTGEIGDAAVAFPTSELGFGHTRWATHGGVTEANAHPHLDCSGRFAVVHNGIVENFRPLRDELAARGHAFRSDTDSEVIAHLLEEEATASGFELAPALSRVFARLEGLNAIIAVDVRTRELVAVKNVSPLVVGFGAGGTTVASDAIALRGHAAEVVYLDDYELARLCRDTVTFYDQRTMVEHRPTPVELPTDERDLELAGHPHYMAKEMAEQPEVLERLVVEAERPIRALAEAVAASRVNFFVGCGTASYAALTGSYLFGRIAHRHVTPVLGSEFASHEHALTPETLVVALSQSGETADGRHHRGDVGRPAAGGTAGSSGERPPLDARPAGGPAGPTGRRSRAMRAFHQVLHG
jgi:glucosamine--fructose-6-phosphate aminotransferase (isomerizing)